MGESLTCALCGEVIEGEPLLFENVHICSIHEDEIGSGNWYAIGHYRREVLGEHRRDVLLSNGLRCLLLQSEEPLGYRLFVDESDKGKAHSILSSVQENVTMCPVCMKEFPFEEIFCPICGEKPPYNPPYQRCI